MPSKVSVGTLAALSDGVFSSNLSSFTPPPGYSLVGLGSSDLGYPESSGMIAHVYQGPSNQFIVVFTGTDLSNSTARSAQLYADQQILHGDSGSDIQPLSAAAQYVGTVQGLIQSQYPGATITLTSHSLGGSDLARLVCQLSQSHGKFVERRRV